jgi:lipopolysaccharide biosynthesis glycosyltransferase
VDIHIACFFDKNFALPALITAASIASCSRAVRPVTLHAFYIGDLDVNFSEQAKLLSSPSFRVEAQKIDNPFEGSSLIAAQNPAYFLRLAVADLLPTLDRVLYLDVDLIVQNDLAPLYDIDLDDVTIAAAEDLVANAIMAKPKTTQSINTNTVVVRRYLEDFLSPGATYFNSGVMVINLRRWRSERCRERALAFMEDRYLVLFADQDALNHILQNDVRFIDAEWNYMPTLDPDGDLDRAKAAKIVHFAAFKPWRYKDQRSLFDCYFWDFAMSTPYGKRLRDAFFGEIAWWLRHAVDQKRKVPAAYQPPVLKSLAGQAVQFTKYWLKQRSRA